MGHASLNNSGRSNVEQILLQQHVDYIPEHACVSARGKTLARCAAMPFFGGKVFLNMPPVCAWLLHQEQNVVKRRTCTIM